MINIYELQNNIRKKEKKQKRIFTKILLQCVKRIKTVAKNEQTECIYSVPNVVFGLPLFNKMTCLDKLYDNFDKYKLLYCQVLSIFICIILFIIIIIKMD